MGDMPKFVRGGPDEPPGEMPFLHRPNVEPSFDRALFEEGKRRGKNPKPTVQQSLFAPPLSAEETAKEEEKVNAGREAARRALEKDDALLFAEQAEIAPNYAVHIELKAYALTKRLCQLGEDRVSIMDIQGGGFRDAVITQLEAELSSENIPSVKVAVREWLLANDAGDHSTREAGALWDQYLFYLEEFSAYVTSNANETQQTSDGRLIIKPTDMDEVVKRRSEGRSLFEQFLKAVQGWYTERTAPKTSSNIPLFTTQELDAVASAQAAGKSSKHYRNNFQDRTRIFEVPGAPFYLEWGLTDQEIDDGMDTSFLENITKHGDADGILATYYALRLLIPTEPIGPNVTPTAWVELDDVIRKIGWKPRSTAQRQEMRTQVYNYFTIIDRGKVKGVRKGKTINPDTFKEMDTRIDAPIWKMGATESDVQLSLIASYEIPRSVELLLSREWLPFLTDPRLVQFLPLGELLGNIDPNQPSGAWARVIGMTLAHHWRIFPRQTLAKTMFMDRKEMLTRYIPKRAPVDELFASDRPGRALDYWRKALDILSGEGFIAKTGEALEPNAKDLPRTGWGEDWLKEKPELMPGPKMLPALAERSESFTAIGAKDLTKKPRKPRSK